MRALRHTMEGEVLPGSDRERERYGTIPMKAGELLDTKLIEPGQPRQTRTFPFESWAAAARFAYPAEALDFLRLTESAAEAFFARAFVVRPGVEWIDGWPRSADGTTLRLQVKRGFLRMDAVAERAGVQLAIEVDGMTFHARKFDQVAADYLRERRLIACGYVLVRFTAQEVFTNAAACWAQIDTILSAHAR